MADGQHSYRHYGGLGQTCGKMVLSVRTPVLNIIDAIWVPFSSCTGYPSGTTHRANQILASQDPVALDYWAAKYIMYPISQSPRHLPTFSGIDQWLTSARDTINGGGGLYDPDSGIQVGSVTKNEVKMSPFIYEFLPPAVTTLAATSIGINSVTLNGTVNPHGLATTYYFEWGTSPSYGNPATSQAAGSGRIDVAVFADLSGLTSNTIYHYRLVATNNEGTSYGQEMTFFTGPPGAATLITPRGTLSLFSPTYYWNAVPYATQYRLIVNDSTGNKVDQWYTAEEAGCASGTGICSVTPSAVLVLGNGNWMIQTRNDIGDGPWSSILDFNIVTNIPKADFNNDGNTDILWRHQGTGGIVAWYMNGAGGLSGTGQLAASGDTNWQIVGR